MVDFMNHKHDEQDFPTALRIIAQMMGGKSYKVDEHGIEALVVAQAADEIEAHREVIADLREQGKAMCAEIAKVREENALLRDRIKGEASEAEECWAKVKLLITGNKD